MPNEITVPRLGWNMDEGVFAGWLKLDGDPVRAGDPLFSLEGEKATQDVEALDAGVLRLAANAPQVGDVVAVGPVIGHLVAADDPILHLIHNSPLPPSPSPRSSPLARRIAKELGVDWTKLPGSGRAGRVRKADVLAAARPDAPRSIAATSTRKAIAARLVESQRTTAPVTLTTTLDASNLVALRQQFKAAGPSGGIAPGITDVLVKLAALALGDHPLLHARWGDGRLELPDAANIGIAVDTESGLIVPVILGASALGLRAIAARSRELIERAREGGLRAGDQLGATFTISNLGTFGVEAFTPIINPPECAVLGVGRIERRPVMDGDRVIGRDRLVLSLTFDHRIVDGAPAARFLQHLSRMIENPGPWLIS